MRTAELSHYRERSDQASAPEVGDVVSAAAPEPIAAAAPSAVADRATPASRALHNLAGWLGSNIGAMSLAVASIALFIAGWYLAVKYRLDFYIRFTNIPSPVDVFDEIKVLSRSNSFYENMLISLRRILLGFGLATLLGIGMGLVIGRYRLVRQFLFPVLEILRPIPAIAWVPIAIMLWPTNEGSIVFITFIGSFFLSCSVRCTA